MFSQTLFTSLSPCLSLSVFHDNCETNKYYCHTHRTSKKTFVLKNYIPRWEIIYGQLPSWKINKINGFRLYFVIGTLVLQRKELEGWFSLTKIPFGLWPTVDLALK
jgi:hypothetical protein